MPRQVLIEVMVAEVSLKDEWEMGVEWGIKENSVNIDGKTFDNYYTSNLDGVGNSVIGVDPITDLAATAFGFTYQLLESGGDAIGVLNAIAGDTDVSILSSPQIMVLNNETAMVNVGEQVPIVTSQTGDISTSNLNQSIEYKDTGVILKVTPRINYDGIIIMEINQQVSSVKANTSSGIESPIISIPPPLLSTII